MREIGKHDGCGGRVLYDASVGVGVRWCDRCAMNSHSHWTDPSGARRPPQAPETVEERARREP